MSPDLFCAPARVAPAVIRPLAFELYLKSLRPGDKGQERNGGGGGEEGWECTHVMHCRRHTTMGGKR